MAVSFRSFYRQSIFLLIKPIEASSRDSCGKVRRPAAQGGPVFIPASAAPLVKVRVASGDGNTARARWIALAPVRFSATTVINHPGSAEATRGARFSFPEKKLQVRDVSPCADIFGRLERQSQQCLSVSVRRQVVCMQAAKGEATARAARHLCTATRPRWTGFFGSTPPSY